ncbi:MAG: cell division protein ZapA [Candidatus Aminicenantes bacterium]|jgi:cell division protein ZapA (FtsZ GTPase activity inhibitor)
MKTKEIEVQILGKHFNFNVPENIKPEDFLEIVDFVEKKFRQIRREAGDLDSFKFGLLAAINIAEEYLSLKKENQQLKDLLTRIDQLLPPMNSEMETDMEEKNQVPILFQLE